MYRKNFLVAALFLSLFNQHSHAMENNSLFWNDNEEITFTVPKLLEAEKKEEKRGKNLAVFIKEYQGGPYLEALSKSDETFVISRELLAPSNLNNIWEKSESLPLVKLFLFAKFDSAVSFTKKISQIEQQKKQVETERDTAKQQVVQLTQAKQKAEQDFGSEKQRATTLEQQKKQVETERDTAKQQVVQLTQAKQKAEQDFGSEKQRATTLEQQKKQVETERDTAKQQVVQLTQAKQKAEQDLGSEKQKTAKLEQEILKLKAESQKLTQNNSGSLGQLGFGFDYSTGLSQFELAANLIQDALKKVKEAQFKSAINTSNNQK